MNLSLFRHSRASIVAIIFLIASILLSTLPATPPVYAHENRSPVLIQLESVATQTTKTVYRTSRPGGYCVHTDHPSKGILSSEFTPRDDQGDVLVQLSKCGGGAFSSSGKVKLIVDNSGRFDNYTLHTESSSYHCGGTIEFRLVPDGDRLKATAQKCGGGSFSLGGDMYIFRGGQQLIGPEQYYPGSSSETIYFNPVNLETTGRHEYQARFWPDEPAPQEYIKSGTVDAWEDYSGYRWEKAVSGGNFDFTFKPADLGLSGRNTYQVHYYPNGQHNPIRSENWQVWDEQVIVEPQGDQYEDDGTLATATNLNTDGSAQRHTMHVVNDQDYISFQALQNYKYRVVVENHTGGAHTVSALMWDDNNDNHGEVIEGTVRKNTGRQDIEWTSDVDAIRWVKIRPEDGTPVGESVGYTVRIFAEAPPPQGDGYEDDDSFPNATNLHTDGSAQQHTLHLDSDIDFYSWQAVERCEYRVVIDNHSNGLHTLSALFWDNQSDGQLDLYEETVRTNAGRQEIVWRTDTPGTRWIKVRVADGMTGGENKGYTIQAYADCTPEDPEPELVTVSGFVHLSGNKESKLAKVQVDIVEGGILRRSVLTSQDGSFNLGELSKGHYRVTASHEDYLEYSGDHDFSESGNVQRSLRASKFTLDIGLDPLQDPSYTPVSKDETTSADRGLINDINKFQEGVKLHYSDGINPLLKDIHSAGDYFARAFDEDQKKLVKSLAMGVFGFVAEETRAIDKLRSGTASLIRNRMHPGLGYFAQLIYEEGNTLKQEVYPIALWQLLRGKGQEGSFRLAATELFRWHVKEKMIDEVLSWSVEKQIDYIYDLFFEGVYGPEGLRLRSYSTPIMTAHWEESVNDLDKEKEKALSKLSGFSWEDTMLYRQDFWKREEANGKLLEILRIQDDILINAWRKSNKTENSWIKESLSRASDGFLEASLKRLAGGPIGTSLGLVPTVGFGLHALNTDQYLANYALHLNSRIFDLIDQIHSNSAAGYMLITGFGSNPTPILPIHPSLKMLPFAEDDREQIGFYAPSLKTLKTGSCAVSHARGYIEFSNVSQETQLLIYSIYKPLSSILTPDVNYVLETVTTVHRRHRRVRLNFLENGIGATPRAGTNIQSFVFANTPTGLYFIGEHNRPWLTIVDRYNPNTDRYSCYYPEWEIPEVPTASTRSRLNANAPGKEIIPYPITQYVGQTRNHAERQVLIGVRNSYDREQKMLVRQPISEGLVVTDRGGAELEEEALVWSLTVPGNGYVELQTLVQKSDAHANSHITIEPASVTILTKELIGVDSFFEVGGAAFSVDDKVSFSNLALETRSTNQAELQFTMHNVLLETTQQGEVEIEVFDSVANQLFKTQSSFSLSASEERPFAFSFEVPHEQQEVLSVVMSLKSGTEVYEREYLLVYTPSVADPVPDTSSEPEEAPGDDDSDPLPDTPDNPTPDQDNPDNTPDEAPHAISARADFSASESGGSFVVSLENISTELVDAHVVLSLKNAQGVAIPLDINQLSLQVGPGQPNGFISNFTHDMNQQTTFTLEVTVRYGLREYSDVFTFEHRGSGSSDSTSLHRHLFLPFVNK
ncbi:MAG: carboxypeptidase-like regulatory domain-containing protein [Chloroflexota bacterium]